MLLLVTNVASFIFHGCEARSNDLMHLTSTKYSITCGKNVSVFSLFSKSVEKVSGCLGFTYLRNSVYFTGINCL